ncbi:MAG: 50S ribosomal protein L19 [bacterium]
MAEKKNKVENKIKFDPIDTKARKALDFHAGDTVKVWSKILDEKGKIRLQAFEGIVLARKHGTETGATFTVRRVASGVGVERIFPLYSPVIDKIEIIKKSRARRSKLYYVRTKAVKDVRRKLRSTVLGNEEPTDIETETEKEKA